MRQYEWFEELKEACIRVLPKGGEVRIQFSKRENRDNISIVPIIYEYPRNRKICKEIVIAYED